MVRAKFRCIDKEGDENNNQIKLEVVVDGNEENKEFFKYTPSGHINMGTINKAAADLFEVGKEYYVDFTPAS